LIYQLHSYNNGRRKPLPRIDLRGRGGAASPKALRSKNLGLALCLAWVRNRTSSRHTTT